MLPPAARVLDILFCLREDREPAPFWCRSQGWSSAGPQTSVSTSLRPQATSAITPLPPLLMKRVRDCARLRWNVDHLLLMRSRDPDVKLATLGLIQIAIRSLPRFQR